MQKYFNSGKQMLEFLDTISLQWNACILPPTAFLYVAPAAPSVLKWLDQTKTDQNWFKTVFQSVATSCNQSFGQLVFLQVIWSNPCLVIVEQNVPLIPSYKRIP